MARLNFYVFVIKIYVYVLGIVVFLDVRVIMELN